MCYFISMKNEMVAIPVFQERVSPLLDVARKFAIYDLVEGEIRQKLIVDVHAGNEALRVDKLKEMGVSVIIGGAVSGFVGHLICERGMRLIPWVCGPVDEIIDRYMRDVLEPPGGEKPGCGRGKRRGRCAGKGRGRNGREVNLIEGEQ
jgi:predicted Fe-Mo cluster-binding NifX family protein